MTIKQQLIPLRIGQGLLSLVALFVMLLAPQRAWAQDNYVLTVVGQKFTAEQLESPITLTGMTSGTATLTPATGTTPVTLTLDNVQYDEFHPGNVVSSIDLKVVFIGTSEFYLENGEFYAFEGNGANVLTLEADGTVEQVLTINNTFQKTIAYNWSSTTTVETCLSGNTSDVNPSCRWWVNANTGATYQLYLMLNVGYDLFINDTQVNSLNRNDVLGNDSRVSFEPATKNLPATLTLDAYQSETNITQPFITNGLSELNIKLEGNNQIHSGPLFLTKSGTDNSDNTVTFTTDLENPGNLTIRAHGEEGVDWHSGHTINYENGLVKSNEYYDNEYSANTVLIGMPDGFGISVAGEQVTPNNLTNVLRDDDNNNNKVSFNPNTNTLYLDGATIAGDIETSLDNLTISVSDANTLTGSVRYTGTNSSSATLTIDANLEYANSASLTLSTESQEIGVISGFNTVSVNAPLETTVTDWTNDLKSATMAAECYDIRVAGVLVTKANKDNVLGTQGDAAPTVSFTPANTTTTPATPATLTLNNATIDLTDSEEYGVKYLGTTALNIKLIGANSIRTQSGCEPIIYDGGSETKPTLTFISGSFPCSLELETSDYTSAIKSFDNVLGVNGINDATGELYIVSNREVVYGEYYENSDTKCLYTFDDQEEKTYLNSATITTGYGIFVAEELIHEGNAENVLGDELDNHMVIFDALTNTLRLNNAELGTSDGHGDIVVSNNVTGIVTIEVNGENVVNGAIRTQGASTLNIVMAANAESASLTVRPNSQIPVLGFSDVTLGKGIYMSSYDNENVYLPNVYYTNRSHQFVTPEDLVPNYIIFSTNEPEDLEPSIWIGGVKVGDGTFDGITGASFNNDTKTLTLTNATLGSVQTASVDIVSSLPSLVIELNDENTIVGSIVSLNPEATLTFKGDGNMFINSDHPVSGFSDDPSEAEDCDLVYLYNGTYAYVKKLDAPVISSLNGTATHIRLSTEEFRTNFSGGVIKYSITYPDVETPVTGEYPTRPDADNESGLALDQPLTIEAWVEYQGKTSATKMGKYFGFKTSSVTVAKGKSIDIPEIVPAYNADDKLVFAFQSADDNIATVDAQTNKITGAKTGTTTVTGNVTYSGETPLSYQILNYSGNLSNLEITVLKDPKFCFYVDGDGTISNGDTEPYVYGEEQTLPELRWDNGSLNDLTGFTITCTSSDANVATIDNTGKITIVGVGLTEIRASIEATGEYAADEAWFTMKVVPAVPKVSIQDGAYFTGQKLSITTDAQGGDLYYSYGYEEDESKRTPYVGEISLPAGEYQFYPYTRCGTSDNPIWSYTVATELYVYDEPTISKDAGEYEGDIEVEITNLPHSDNVSVTAYYYLGDDEENAKLYTAGDKITVSESTKLNVYLLVEGDSNKKYKTEEVIVRKYEIKDIPLDVTAADFHNHWMTYYHNNNGNVGLPENQNIGAYVATSISGNEIVVTQIKSIPRGEPVLLNNETTTTTTNVFGQDVQGNLLLHADKDLVVDEEQGDYYGLYNGAFMHVKGTIPAGKNYLLIPAVVNVNTGASQLTIVIDGETTGVNDVRSKMKDVRGDIYDLQGRKVQKPSKKGLYINKGHKVVIK